jgi:oligopeptide transport system substrate-binding protein
LSYISYKLSPSPFLFVFWRGQSNQISLKNSLFIVIILFLLSCTNPDKRYAGKTVFNYNEPSGITSLDPAFSKDYSNIKAVSQLFNGLVQLDDNLKVQPCIAKSWEISNDGRQYIFHIRNDVYFHDDPLFKDGKGRKVIANDFVYSFNRIIDKNTASPGAWIFNNVNNPMISNEAGFKPFIAKDDSTFIINLKKSYPPFISILTMQYCSVVPKEIVEHYGKDFRSHPIGTGPFMFHLWKEGEKLILWKNPNYFESENGNRLPYLDAVAISFITNKQAAFTDFTQGKFDLNSSIDASYKDELLNKDGSLQKQFEGKFKMIRQPFLNTEYLGILLDTTAPVLKGSPLKLKAIRQAINYGFDRKLMMTYLRNNIGTPGIAGMVPDGMPSFDSTKVIGYDYNQAKAKKLLKDAGFPNGKGLPIITLNTTSTYADLCEYIQGQLEGIGIKIKIDINQAGQHLAMVSQLKLPFFRGSWIADYPDAENYLSLFYSKNFTPSGPNYTHFKNTAFDSLYEKSLTITNDSIRFNLYQQMDSLVMEEAPVVVLYYDQSMRLIQNNIEGLSTNPMNSLVLKRVKKL